MACLSLGWRPLSATKVRTLDGNAIDLHRRAPNAVAHLAMTDARAASDATCCSSFPWQGPIFWHPIHSLMRKSADGWTNHHKACLRSSVSGCLWTCDRAFAAGYGTSPNCLLCGDRDSLFHRRYECSVWNQTRLQCTSALHRGAASELNRTESGAREAFARGIFPLSGTLFPSGSPRRPDIGTVDQQASTWPDDRHHFHGRQLTLSRHPMPESRVGPGDDRCVRRNGQCRIWSGAS